MISYVWCRTLPEARPPLGLRLGADLSTHQCIFEGDVLVAKILVDSMGRVTLPTERKAGKMHSGDSTMLIV